MNLQESKSVLTAHKKWLVDKHNLPKVNEVKLIKAIEVVNKNDLSSDVGVSEERTKVCGGCKYEPYNPKYCDCCGNYGNYEQQT